MHPAGRKGTCFLFTDLESSTSLWEHHPETMSAALATHDALLQGAVETNDGSVFSWTGDGLSATFEDPDRALHAALEAQRRIEGHEWPDDCVLRIRIGIHVGEAEARNGEYYGTTVNRAARITSAGHGGQILVSSDFAELVDPAAHPSVRFREEGDHRLKGVSIRMGLVTALGDGLPVHFPPLRVLDETRHSIPVTFNELVGRDRDVAGIAAMLRESRLVSVLGPGGTGKTRVAIEVANESVSHYSGGVHVVELASISDGAGVLPLIADTVLGSNPLASPEEAGPRLRAGLRRPTLIVLDNCEHVIEAATAAAEELLGGSPHPTLLTTSRERLFLEGEHLVQLEPLDTLHLDRADWADSASSDPTHIRTPSAAATLFLQRARAAAPKVGEFDVRQVERVCERLDGLPLALELAAARLSALSLTELEANLIDVLRSGRRGRRGGGRHATIDAAVRWSYDALDLDEKVVLARCSVFVGTFDLAAASAVCGADDFTGLETIELIGALADRSFLSSVYSEAGNRFRLLEIVRSFAADQLAELGDPAETGRRHQAHFLERAQGLRHALDNKPEPHLLQAVAVDDANYLAALSFVDDPDSIEIARRLTMRIHPYWEETGRLADAIRVTTALLRPRDPRDKTWRSVAGLNVTYESMVGSADPEIIAALQASITDEPDPSRANAYFAVAFAALSRADFGEACDMFDLAARSLEGFGGGPQREAWMTAGSCAANDDRPARALEFYALADQTPPPVQGWFPPYLDVFRRSAEIQLRGAVADTGVGAHETTQRDADAIVASLTEIGRLGLAMRTTVAAVQAGIALADARRWSDLEESSRLGLVAARENGFLWSVAVFVEFMAWTATVGGQADVAAERWGVVDAHYEATGHGQPPAHSRRRTHHWAQAEAAIDDAAFRRAYREGRSRSLAVYADELLAEHESWTSISSL